MLCTTNKNNILKSEEFITVQPTNALISIVSVAPSTSVKLKNMPRSVSKSLNKFGFHFNVFIYEGYLNRHCIQ